MAGIKTYRGGPCRLFNGHSYAALLRAAFLSESEPRDLLTRAGFTEVATMHYCFTTCQTTGLRGDAIAVFAPWRRSNFLPGQIFVHVSVQTTQRYLGCTQRIRGAVNRHIGIEP
jgi:hypothetical protein